MGIMYSNTVHEPERKGLDKQVWLTWASLAGLTACKQSAHSCNSNQWNQPHCNTTRSTPYFHGSTASYAKWPHVHVYRASLGISMKCTSCTVTSLNSNCERLHTECQAGHFVCPCCLNTISSSLQGRCGQSTILGTGYPLCTLEHGCVNVSSPLTSNLAPCQQCNTYELITLLATAIQPSIEQWSGCKQPSGVHAAVHCESWQCASSLQASPHKMQN